MTTFHADEGVLEGLSDDVGGLWCRRIETLDSPPDSFTFLRDFVHPNVPCIIKNAIIISGSDGADHFATLTLDEIIERVGEDVELTVDVTPDGRGDCIRNVLEANEQRKMFVKPHEKRMDIGRFRDLLRRGRGNENDTDGLDVFPFHANYTENECPDSFDEIAHHPVVYYSQQNDCLRTEMAKLFATQIFPKTLSFAEQVFGTGPPDAINLWVGNEHSVSSMHKDHYENLFYVCSGQKEFILCPPADVLFLHEGDFKSGTFQIHDSEANRETTHNDSDRPSWIVVADNSDNGEDVTTKWIEPDIKQYMNMKNATCDDSEFPLLSKAHPIKVLVSEGEMLYIPSLWYHRVTQTCETVGINYWFDMRFDTPHWCYFNFLQNLRRNE